jgi:hypothetical protein
VLPVCNRQILLTPGWLLFQDRRCWLESPLPLANWQHIARS